MGTGGDFKVTRSKKEVVAAALPLQEHWLPLSNLDLLLPPVDFCVFFCYKKPATDNSINNTSFTFGSMVSVLKKALAQALVSYYAFAGEIVQNSIGEPELLCNNRGVEFIEAYADVDLQELNLYNPDESIEGKLVTKKKDGVLAVQATELRCGGLVVSCTIDHRIADAYSANMFLVSWAEMARSRPLSHLPCFRRSLLNPRHPGFHDPSIDNMYVPISTLPPPKEAEDILISRIYYVTADELSKLQALCSVNGNKRTKLESFSAFLWKMVAGTLDNSDNEKICKMGIVVDGRARLSEDGGEKFSSLMSTYFGNVLSIPFGEKMVGELKSNSSSWVANAIHDYLDGAVNKEHFLSLIDWVEAHRPEPSLAKTYCNGTEYGPSFVVSSGQRFPVSKVDFGWGKPFFGSYHFPWGGDSGYVMPMPNPTHNGDWIVYMHLLKKQLDVIETRAANVLRPLTFAYLA